MTARLTIAWRWARLLDAILGPKCAITGERIFPRDMAAHSLREHGVEGTCIG